MQIHQTGSVGLTSCVTWDRSGTCRCAHAAAAPEQTRVRVSRGGRGGNNAMHFAAPTKGKSHNHSELVNIKDSFSTVI